jgi:hypothetical protein
MRLSQLCVTGFAGLLTLCASQAAEARHYGDTITCESRDRRPRSCYVGDELLYAEVYIDDQLSNTDCIRDQNWGVSDDSIWVDEGCRAVFRWELETSARTLRCSSRGGDYARCYIGDEYVEDSVVLVDNLSDTRCREGDNWGVRGSYIWVDEGCRAEFEYEVYGD